MKIPSYKEALERHETALDVFISRWEPVHKTDKKTFLEDLSALIAYIETTQQSVQADEAGVCPDCGYVYKSKSAQPCGDDRTPRI